MSNEIIQSLLIEFKERMKLSDDEDSNLTRILLTSIEDLRSKCGDYDLSNLRFKELVFERSRYVYNDALEFFNTNFISHILDLAIPKELDRRLEGETNETE